MINPNTLNESFNAANDPCDAIVALVTAAFGTDALALAYRDDDEGILTLTLRTVEQANAAVAMLEMIMYHFDAETYDNVSTDGVARVTVRLFQ